MSPVSGRELGNKIASALGIDPAGVTQIRIITAADDVARVQIERHAPKNTEDVLPRILEEFELHEKT